MHRHPSIRVFSANSGMPVPAVKFIFVILFVLIIMFSVPEAAEKKAPVTQYWMDVATQNMSIPGMPKSLPGMEGLFGKMGGPRKSLQLYLNSPKALPPDPFATHDIPPGQLMGKTLPLMIPEKVRTAETFEEYREEKQEKFEKPKFRMLIYWGCSETVRPGQPRIIDTEKMSPADFGKALAGRALSPQYPPSERSGWIYADWPNRKSRIDIAEKSSLTGDHLVRGNYTPDISFALDVKRDFMAPVEFTSVKGSLSEAIRFQWKSIPTSIGYFATAMSHNQKTGETIFWSSSDVEDTGFSLMGYLPNADVYKLIKEQVIMGTEVSSCVIPGGIFRDTNGGMLQFIAYGEELNIAYPPKPKDSAKPHEYIWALKVRLKSEGMHTLGSGDMATGRERNIPDITEEEAEEELPQPQSRQKPDPKTEKLPTDTIKGTLNKVRGLFGF